MKKLASFRKSEEKQVNIHEHLLRFCNTCDTNREFECKQRVVQTNCICKKKKKKHHNLYKNAFKRSQFLVEKIPVHDKNKYCRVESNKVEIYKTVVRRNLYKHKIPLSILLRNPLVASFFF